MKNIKKENKKNELNLPADEYENHTDFNKEFMKLVNQNIIDFIKNIDIHIQKRDLDKINSSCHKIKFGLKMMKIDNLLSISNRISLEAKNNGDIKHIKFLFNQFNNEYLNIRKEIIEQIKNVK